MPLGKIKYAIAIDYDPVEDMIYWSDGDTRSIMRAKQEGAAEGSGPQHVEVSGTNENLKQRNFTVVHDLLSFKIYLIFSFPDHRDQHSQR